LKEVEGGGSDQIRIRVAAAVLALVATMAVTSASSATEPNTYIVHSLVSDERGVGPVALDPKPINPLGLQQHETPATNGATSHGAVALPACARRSIR
jgi:hypothetical protein